jgi:hypothetical protein
MSSKTPQSVLGNITSLEYAFNKEAELINGYKAVLQDSREVIEGLIAEKEALQNLLLKYIKPDTFLILDGSASMEIPSRDEKIAPIYVLRNAVRAMDTLARGHLTIVHSGQKKIIEPHEIEKNKYAATSNMAPALSVVDGLLKKSAKNQKVVLVGDGDITDVEETLTAFDKILSANKTTTLDLVLIKKDAEHYSYKKMAATLIEKFPNRIFLTETNGVEGLKQKLEYITTRSADAAPKNAPTRSIK